MLKTRFIALISVLLALLLSGIFIFPYPAGFGTFISESDFSIVYHFRLPAVLTAAFCGMALAVSGHILQQLFKNTLAGPYILGVSSGASLMVALVIISACALPFLSSNLSIHLSGSIGALLVLL